MRPIQAVLRTLLAEWHVSKSFWKCALTLGRTSDPGEVATVFFRLIVRLADASAKFEEIPGNMLPRLVHRDNDEIDPDAGREQHQLCASKTVTRGSLPTGFFFFFCSLMKL